MAFDPDQTQPVVAPNVLRKLTEGDIELLRGLPPEGSTINRQRYHQLNHWGLVDKKFVGWIGRHNNNARYRFSLTPHGAAVLEIVNGQREGQEA